MNRQEVLDQILARYCSIMVGPIYGECDCPECVSRREDIAHERNAVEAILMAYEDSIDAKVTRLLAEKRNDIA